MALTYSRIDKAPKKDKPYKLFDEGGLYVLINPNGSKLWRFKYRFQNKEKLISFGPFKFVTIAEARERCREAKRDLCSDPPKDPMAKRYENRYLAIRNAENTFKAVALEWYEINASRWSENYTRKIRQGLELNIFPFLGARPISEISPPELLQCLRRIEKRGSLDICGRTKQICGQIFRYGIQTGKCERDASADLRGALKAHQKEHFRTVSLEKLPDFLQALERNEVRLFERTRRAVWLSLLTFARPGEIRQARWEDINFETCQWLIPARLMKKRRDHIIPLSKQVLKLFLAQKEELYGINTEWVFPSQISFRKPMSDGTVNKAIKRLGYGKDMVAHGFRALARTAIAEELGYEGEIVEKQLSHKTKNPLGEAYDRTQFLEKRRVMMQDWANYIDELREGAIKVSLKAA